MRVVLRLQFGRVREELQVRATPPGLCIFLGTHSPECAALLLGYYRVLPPGGWSWTGVGCSLEFGCFCVMFLPVAAYLPFIPGVLL
jgi:hypothetical protein